MSPISLILVASLTLVGFHSETTLAMDSGMDNGLQTVEDRAIDCNDEPGSMNAGATSAKGCAGAVWSDGSFSSDYCTNTGWAKGRFPWWGKCCKISTRCENNKSSRMCSTSKIKSVCVPKDHYA